MAHEQLDASMDASSVDEPRKIDESSDEPVVPEVEPAPVTSGAMVPAAPSELLRGRFRDGIARFLTRVMPASSVQVPAELLERLDALEVQIAGLEELLTKRLEEGEGRTLHLVEKRLEVLHEEVRGMARRAAAREVATQTQPLRILILAVGGLAVGLAAAALVFALGIF